MTVNTSYTQLGDKLIVPQADLENLVSAANAHGDTRVGGNAIGKAAGMEVLCSLTSDGTYSKVMALGGNSSSAWRVLDGSENYTPVNIGAWTTSTGCTYAAGLLTADGIDDPTTTQVIALKAGTYRITGTMAGEGTYAADYHTPKMTVTGGTDGALISKVWNKASDVTVSAVTGAENATKVTYNTTFTLTVDQNVTISLLIVDQDGAAEAGSGYIKLDALEAA